MKNLQDFPVKIPFKFLSGIFFTGLAEGKKTAGFVSGTVKAAAEPIKESSRKFVGLPFVVKLNFLNGRAKFDDCHVSLLLRYDS